MTHEQLVTKAIKWLRKIERHFSDGVRYVPVDRLPKRRVRDAVVIDFYSDENGGSTQVVMERETGIVIEAGHTPSKRKAKQRKSPKRL